MNGKKVVLSIGPKFENFETQLDVNGMSQLVRKLTMSLPAHTFVNG